MACHKSLPAHYAPLGTLPLGLVLPDLESCILAVPSRSSPSTVHSLAPHIPMHMPPCLPTPTLPPTAIQQHEQQHHLVVAIRHGRQHDVLVHTQLTLFPLYSNTHPICTLPLYINTHHICTLGTPHITKQHQPISPSLPRRKAQEQPQQPQDRRAEKNHHGRQAICHPR